MPDPQLLTRGVISGQGINAGATAYFQGPSGINQIHCEGDDTLSVEVDMTGAAVGDLAVTVEPYAGDGATVMPIALPPVQTVGPTFAAGHVYFYAQYDVNGIDIARVGIKNNNAGNQTITNASWKLT